MTMLLLMMMMTMLMMILMGWIFICWWHAVAAFIVVDDDDFIFICCWYCCRLITRSNEVQHMTYIYVKWLILAVSTNVTNHVIDWTQVDIFCKNLGSNGCGYKGYNQCVIIVIAFITKQRSIDFAIGQIRITFMSKLKTCTRKKCKIYLSCTLTSKLD